MIPLLALANVGHQDDRPEKLPASSPPRSTTHQGGKVAPILSKDPRLKNTRPVPLLDPGQVGRPEPQGRPKARFFQSLGARPSRVAQHLIDPAVSKHPPTLGIQNQNAHPHGIDEGAVGVPPLRKPSVAGQLPCELSQGPIRGEETLDGHSQELAHHFKEPKVPRGKVTPPPTVQGEKSGSPPAHR